MTTSAQKIKTRLEARQSKLKNKRAQLENLLRSRARKDYEIQNLKKSIAKDQKKVLKEATLLKSAKDSQGILEAFSCPDTGDSLDYGEDTEILDCFQQVSDELDSILALLLRYNEV